ncbi:MAG TPA: methylenetetrahydrofolate reductase [Candidatus Agrococcus pullicola]|uniref:Methylenetetrahydrofolate reductase n=1 Tax=Candidatus Agrococcus pullicola TaxID=2838429 RepID=A0A9D2CA32_9MICO|nr:methylenetetrahydrofolate reductase [Candidatus Agrococcus pullicola]
MERAAITALRTPRFEMVPMRGVEEAIDHLPQGAIVTVTCSPTHGFDATIPLVRELRRRGHPTVPHLAARMVEGHDHLARLIDTFDELGVNDAFVIAGDAETPRGPYDGAIGLLEAMHDNGHPFEQIGITGYPEKHAVIPDTQTIAAMADKARFATYIVSQICFDATTVEEWIAAMRARGIDLPLHIGIPGVADRTRLLRISSRIGLRDAARFLTKQAGVAVRAAVGYTPDRLIDGLADVFERPESRIVGWHVFSFNEIARTNKWRTALLARRLEEEKETG